MENTKNPQINFSKTLVGGNIAGALFALSTIAICVTGLPAVRYALPAALVVGCGVALALRLLHRETPRVSWIFPPTKK